VAGTPRWQIRDYTRWTARAGTKAPKWENTKLMSASSTGDERAMNILRELHAAEKELVGRAVVLTDGKAGTIGQLRR
jgi:hypothetical protein